MTAIKEGYFDLQNSPEKIKKAHLRRMETLTQLQIINEETINSVSSLIKVSSLNSKSKDREYHAQEQAPQGFIAADLLPPEKS